MYQQPVDLSPSTSNNNSLSRRRCKRYLIILIVSLLLFTLLTTLLLLLLNQEENKNKEDASNDKIENNTQFIDNNNKNNNIIYDNIDLNSDYIDFNPKKIHIKIEQYSNPSTIRNYPLDKKTDTKCLDGSQYGIYYSPGRGNGINKVIIGFEGMGWCYDKDPKKIPEICKDRTNKYYGSSKTWKDEYIYDYNIYGGEESKNEQFYNWHRFIIPYCDGTGNQGYIKDAINVGGMDLFFRGYRNTVEGLKFVFQHVDIDSLETVVVWGCSSGAWSAFQWMNPIENYLNKVNNKIAFLGIMTGGYFIDYKSSKSNDNNFMEKFKSMYSFVNLESSAVNKDCLEDYKKTPYKCLFPEVLMNYIKSPILMFQAQYDSFQIWEVLEEKCVDDHRSLKFCNDDQRKNIIELRDYTYEKIQRAIEKKKNLSIFSPECVMHCYIDSQRKSFDLKVNGYNIDKTITQFVNEKGKKQIILIDNLNWPNNKGCGNS
jgi:hypothetical protein